MPSPSKPSCSPKAWSSSKLPDLIKEITALPEPRPIENRLPLWSHWSAVAAIILLLAIFWIGRKLNGAF